MEPKFWVYNGYSRLGLELWFSLGLWDLLAHVTSA